MITTATVIAEEKKFNNRSNHMLYAGFSIDF